MKAVSAAAAEHRALWAGALVVLLWGASFSIQKGAYEAMGPGAFLFLRSVLMVACALLVLRWRRSALWPTLAPREWRVLLTCTALGPVAHIVLVTYGIHWSTPFSSALIMACGPVCTLLLVRVWRGTRMSGPQAAGVVVALAGVLLVMGDKLAGADWRASGGDALMLLAVVVGSLHTIGITPLVQRHGGPEIMCWTTLLAAPGLLLLNAAEAAQAPMATFSPAAWLAFTWTVVVAAFFGWMLWSWVNAVRGVARTAPLLYGVPPVAGLVAWLAFGESFGGLKLAGAALALGGVALTQRAARGGGTGSVRGEPLFDRSA